MAFIDSQPTDVLFAVDRLVDLCFLVDVFINFNLCYYDDDLKRYVQSRMLITRRCVRGARALQRPG